MKDKKFSGLIGFFSFLFGAIIIINNPINFQYFPQNVPVNTWVGIVLMIVGAMAIYYGFRED